MFVNLLEPPRHTRLVDATHMIGAQRLVAQGWTVCNSYLDGYTGEPTVEGRAAFAAEVERAVSSLPERCVVLTAGIPLQQRDPRRFVCNNSAVCGTGAVPIPYWFEDQSQPVPFASRRHFAAFQGAVASNGPLRAAVVEGFGGCERAVCRVNERYFHALGVEDRQGLSASYWQLLSETQFSLCPRGDDCGSVRFYESLAAGCIPVLLADGAELPLARMLPWDDMLVRVPECEARHWQSHVARWKAKRTDEELAILSQHNRQTWQDWFHWSQLGKQLTVERVERAIAAAERHESGLSRGALSVPGMTSGRVRHLLNNLAARRYLEVGVWQGATFVAACYGRRLESATGIDNFSTHQEQPGGAERFLANVSAMLPDQPIALRSVSFFDLPPEALPQNVDVYFYDGDHRPESQRQAILQAWPALADEAIILIDDTNYPGVLEATRQGLAAVGAKVLHEWLLPARFNGDTEQWWNGLYVAAVRKPIPAFDAIHATPAA